MWRLALVCVAGCDLVFTLKDPGPLPPDALPPGQFAHLPPTIGVGDVDVKLADMVVIDTTTRSITPGIAVALVEVEQTLPGPPIVVLQANTVTITGNVRVEGSRPFAIVARSIQVEAGGLVDVSGSRAVGGAGSRPANGPGGGAAGNPDPDETGILGSGGGGGFAEPGGLGGPAAVDCPVTAGGGLGGAAYGVPELDVLEGGAGGGGGTVCGTQGGRGGGGIQLSATDTITILGTIDAGGGGGNGGMSCGSVAEGGGGGGAGGAIYLEAPMIDFSGVGVLTANGGGGGGGGGCSVPINGAPGIDGPPSLGVAPGGLGGEPACSGAGGTGGGTNPVGENQPPASGDKNLVCSSSYGGGGGGSAGRIVVRGIVIGSGIESPSAIRLQ